LRAASRRAWPAMIVSSGPIKIGLTKPNSRILAVIWLICSLGSAQD
jgi:hypothetical protein